MIKHHLIRSFAVAIFCIATAISAHAAPFKLTTILLNGNTGQPQSTFHPGDLVFLRVTADVPPNAQNKTVKLSVTAKATAYGLQFPLRILGNSALANNLELADPSLSGPLIQTGDEELRFKIHKKAPNGTVQVTVKATIKGVGTTTSITTVPVVR